MKNKSWDAVIVGTGFGGSMVALRLAAAGMSVLMLERGRKIDRDDSAWDVRQILVDSKYQSRSPYYFNGKRRRSPFFPNEAIGGNSPFYGGVSFRLRVEDFKKKSLYGSQDGAKSPYVDWPIKYEDLKSYYDEAEELLGVAGVEGADLFEPPRDNGYTQSPPPFGFTANMVSDAAKSIGLRPFPIPLAINFRASADREKCVLCNTCDLFPCKISAKNDLSVTVLPEAVRSGAVIKQEVIAKRLIKSAGRIKRVECLDLKTGETFDVSCGLCVVCGGAIESPKLLIASGLDNIKPNGLLIGRFLMRHVVGIVIGLFPFKTNPENIFNKQVAINDFYFGHPESRMPNGPWGVIQSLQVPPPEYIARYGRFPVGSIGARTTEYHVYLLCIAEDVPNPNNRVKLNHVKRDIFGLPTAHITHSYCKRDFTVRRALYREAAKILHKAGALIRLRKPVNTISHACGTCRFGEDPETSVLDPMCNFHGIPNLFVVDSSFMPTSSGVNPSLTIAANGLRVGKYIAGNWEQILK
ncbi:MAG: GMC family oxidoreductase [Candidatus Zixiibacteriota bacterium]|nr:MAG: GMC family oxidoreductase [candidate division Zixibacteria bacterium]